MGSSEYGSCRSQVASMRFSDVGDSSKFESNSAQTTANSMKVASGQVDLGFLSKIA